MEKEKTVQLELFSQETGGPQQRSGSPRFSLFHVRGYEKVIVPIISVFITAIISFSLGVEKGKKLVSAKREPAPVVEAKQNTVIANEVQKPEPRMAVESPVITAQLNYTIQLACYKTRSYAEREAEGLRKKGFVPLIIKKGDFVVLCVGKFPDKSRLKPLLTELGKRYQGCYIRGL